MASNTNDQKAPDIHTGYPGFVYNFNTEDQCCDVQLAIESLFVGTVDAYTIVPKARLLKVPVQFIQGGGFSFTHPVPDGEPCYVHFAERGIDHWLSEGKDSAGFINGKPSPSFGQLFSHNAAICIIGVRPATRVIAGFQGDVAEFRNADRSIRVTMSDSNVIIVAGSTLISVNKDGDILAQTTTKATIKAPQIVLDGDTTITKTLTVNGGFTAKAGMDITGDAIHAGSYTLNGISVGPHKHTNPEGGFVGPMM